MRLLLTESHSVFAETVASELFAEDSVALVSSIARARELTVGGEPFDALLVASALDDGLGTGLVRSLREEGFGGLVVAVSADDDQNLALVREGADVACNKLAFRSLRPVLNDLLCNVELDTERLARAARSLDGLSVGDAFGQRFFGPEDWALERIRDRRLPASPWVYTDDTEMAIAITEVLAEHGRIEPSSLARGFARRFAAEPNRGYGGGAVQLLQQIREGTPWREAASSLFGGQGSMGNGGAMRVAPVGAYFAHDLLEVIRQARMSASVTHAHIEGQAGAIAVAAAAAYAWRKALQPSALGPDRLLSFAERVCPPGPTREGLKEASRLPEGTSAPEAAARLGSGNRLLSSDTVPFALWCAEKYLRVYEDALWGTVEGLGDRDTTCAMVGGIVAARSLPPDRWLDAREPLRFEHGTPPGQRPGSP